jgi:hypothetical protein
MSKSGARQTQKAEPPNPELSQLYRSLAETLAVVTQHPATPASAVKSLQPLAKLIAQLAGVETESMATPRPGVEGRGARDVFLEFGLAVAAALESDSTPADVWNQIGDWTDQVESLLKPENTRIAEAARLRGVLQGYASLGAQTQTVGGYAPEIEARRADYERLAECLVVMTRLSNARVDDLLDLEGWEEGSEDHLINAIDGHLKALWQNLDWYDARTLRKFYAEMRLHAAQLGFELEQARRRIEAEEADKQKAA